MVPPEVVQQLRDLCAHALDGDDVSDWERGYLEDLRARCDEWESRLTLSIKQWRIIDRICSRTKFQIVHVQELEDVDDPTHEG